MQLQKAASHISQIASILALLILVQFSNAFLPIKVAKSPYISIDFKLVQPSKAPSPIDSIMSGMSIFSKLIHPLKVSLPISSISCGKFTSVKLVQPRNALIVSLIVSGNSTFLRLVHPQKLSNILVTPCGIFIFVMLLQPTNAHSISVIPSGIIISLKLLQSPKIPQDKLLSSEGILTYTSFSQPSKILLPIFVILFGKSIDSSIEQSAKASSFISLTISGTIILFTVLQFANALFDIQLTLLGIITFSELPVYFFNIPSTISKFKTKHLHITLLFLCYFSI